MGSPRRAAALEHGPRGSARAELAGIIDELYSSVEDNRDLLALVEQVAMELPQVFQLWFVQRRRGHFDALGRYLTERIRSGHLRAVPDVPTAVRFLVETVAWFAWHRLGDPDSATLTDDRCRDTVRHLLLAAFLRTEEEP